MALRHGIIDLTDEQILKRLLDDSRTSFTALAKDCHISVSAVKKRYTRLKKAGVITGEIMQINPENLGYKCIVTLTLITSKEDEDEVLDFLRSKPYTCKLFKNDFEKTNLAAIISLHEVKELAKTVREIEANPMVKKVFSFIWSKTSDVDYPENLVLLPSSKTLVEQPRTVKPHKFVAGKIDDTDRCIAEMLVENSRIPFKRISENLGISVKNVIERYGKLKEKLDARPRIMVDLKKLGYNAMALLFIKASNRSKTPEILDQLLKVPDVMTALDTVGGEYDLFFIIVLRDYTSLFALKEQLRKIQNIEQSEIILGEPYTSWPLNVFPSLLREDR